MAHRVPQPGNAASDDKALVDGDGLDVHAVAARQAYDPVRPGAAVPQVGAEVRQGATNREPVGVRRDGERRANLSGESGCEFFVGVERQDPIAAREVERRLLLPAEIVERARLDTGAGTHREFDCAIRRPRIEDDDLIGQIAHRRQTALDVPFFVSGDDEDRQHR